LFISSVNIVYFVVVLELALCFKLAR